MKNLEDIQRTISLHKKKLCRKYAIKKIGIFGSYVKGNNVETSDLDILVEFTKTPDLIEFCEIERVLEELLGVKVDLVEAGSIKPRIKSRILSEVLFL